ncbi:MAG: GntR family transcriptional regulator [Dethiobacteria bacterium]|jgi:DNA-binding GntR family transcriptional regulator|nr:GntR family transcriptional regulator [Bacillota bacterium]
MAINGFTEQDDAKKYLLSTKISDELRHKIVTGKLKPGEGLTEKKLAEEFKVSRTPIREAIRQLETEGLVRLSPKKGAIVEGITGRDIEEIYTIRMMIEGLAARWAAERITREEAEKLRELIEFLEFFQGKGEVERMTDLDNKFHQLILEASKSKALKHALRGFMYYAQQARITSIASPGRAEKMYAEHLRVYKAIVDRNPEEAEKAMQEHVMQARSNLLVYI